MSIAVHSVVDPHHFDADPDGDPDSTYHPWCGSGFRFLFDADPDANPDSTFHHEADPDPDPDPSFQIKAQTLEKVLKSAHIPYILACHLQIDVDPVPVPVPDPSITLMRIWMRIRIFI